MKQINELLTQLYVRMMLPIKSERGQTLVEYALILVLIALAAIAAMKLLGTEVNCTYCQAQSTLKAK